MTIPVNKFIIQIGRVFFFEQVNFFQQFGSLFLRRFAFVQRNDAFKAVPP
ncbi:hypothetical protein AK34_2973 [Burkholderia dolosa AU0158]|nr:hypothetical protein AK34_2973 [Burkholderia dolosa AU0158]ETP66721.1 hypothetical protein BDSB_00755 [Burkholderia dolosa PC543]VWB30743.1 hypothetical protein BDO18943_01297 [Burkholderia dolosa]